MLMLFKEELVLQKNISVMIIFFYIPLPAVICSSTQELSIYPCSGEVKE